MYKRKARILFLSSGAYAGLARIACAWASCLGQAWLESRAATLDGATPHPGSEQILREQGFTPAPNIEIFTTTIFVWADLVVTLDPDTDALCPTLQPGMQKRHWRLSLAPATHTTGSIESNISSATPDPLSDLLTFNAAIKDRVEGLIGGLKMLARLKD